MMPLTARLKLSSSVRCCASDVPLPPDRLPNTRGAVRFGDADIPVFKRTSGSDRPHRRQVQVPISPPLLKPTCGSHLTRSSIESVKLSTAAKEQRTWGVFCTRFIASFRSKMTKPMSLRLLHVLAFWCAVLLSGCPDLVEPNDDDDTTAGDDDDSAPGDDDDDTPGDDDDSAGDCLLYTSPSPRDRG